MLKLVNIWGEIHPLIPFNPVFKNYFFHTGLIEAWGRGE